MSTEATKLTGTALLERVKELGHAKRGDVVRACGYVSLKKDGGERLNFTGFYKALTDAKGLLAESSAEPSQGRRLNYSAAVGRETGQIVIGRRYVEMLGLQGGDRVEIKFSRGQLRLIPHLHRDPQASEDPCEDDDIEEGVVTTAARERELVTA